MSTGLVLQMSDKLFLFDNVDRVDFNRVDHSESRFFYLNRSAHRRHDYIRETLQEWFDAFDATAEKREKTRTDFRSQNDKEHLSAFFELEGD
jgi:hypothetical protein